MVRKSLWTVLIVTLGVFMLFVGGMNAGYENSLEEYPIENESATIDYSTEYSVTNSNIAEGFNETVTIYANNTTLESSSDYDWNSTSGNVTWYNTTTTTENETAYINYIYYDHPEETTFGYNVMYIASVGIALLVLFVAARYALKGVW